MVLQRFYWACTQSVGILGQKISLSRGRLVYTGQHKQNKHIQTSMPRVGLEPTITVCAPTKTVHGLECAATMIGGVRIIDGINQGEIILYDAVNRNKVSIH
jgi:hypothetical protein